jgi:hypothetical protein
MPGRTAQEYLSGRFERAFERRRDLMDADRLGQVAVVELGMDWLASCLDVDEKPTSGGSEFAAVSGLFWLPPPPPGPRGRLTG